MPTSTNKSRVIAFIFARGGSQGIPRKNLKLLGEKPLIAHAIQTALASSHIERVIVSTDDDEIAATAIQYGAEAPFSRPAELASSTAPEWLAWQHAISWVFENRGEFDIFLSLPATAPFRTVGDVNAAIDCLTQHDDTDIVITASPAARSPYFNMVKLDPDGYASLAVEGDQFVRRQDTPRLFDMTTVAYAARPQFILTQTGIFDGYVRMVEIPADRALDIDTPLDFEFARFLAARNNEQSK